MCDGKKPGLKLLANSTLQFSVQPNKLSDVLRGRHSRSHRIYLQEKYNPFVVNIVTLLWCVGVLLLIILLLMACSIKGPALSNFLLLVETDGFGASTWSVSDTKSVGVYWMWFLLFYWFTFLSHDGGKKMYCLSEWSGIDIYGRLNLFCMIWRYPIACCVFPWLMEHGSYGSCLI